jgi:hypothetical protein
MTVHNDCYQRNTSALPIPIGVLDQGVLEEFISSITAEVDQEFRHQEDGRTRRNTREYGLSFFKMLRSDFTFNPPPEFLQELGKRVCRGLGHEPPNIFTNIILSVYEKDFHLEPHVDVGNKDRYGDTPFYFDERVYGVVIEADPTGHLYFAKWEGPGLVPPLEIEPVFCLKEQKGTIFCLEGDFRSTPYFHAVSCVSNQRISITFRTVRRVDDPNESLAL